MAEKPSGRVKKMFSLDAKTVQEFEEVIKKHCYKKSAVIESLMEQFVKDHTK